MGEGTSKVTGQPDTYAAPATGSAEIAGLIPSRRPPFEGIRNRVRDETADGNEISPVWCRKSQVPFVTGLRSLDWSAPRRNVVGSLDLSSHGEAATGAVRSASSLRASDGVIVKPGAMERLARSASQVYADRRNA